MRKLARWHIVLGWLIVIPLVLWTASGLLMALRPIDEVRGATLRLPREPSPVYLPWANIPPGERMLREGRLLNQNGRSILLATRMDGSVARIDLANPVAALPPVDAAEARQTVARAVRGGNQISAVQLFPANAVPFDFRKPMAVWQVTLQDQTHVYVGRDTGEIEAIRTGWWRAFDFMWGLHIMDPAKRDNSSHPLLIGSALLSLVGVLLGAILLFKRRRSAR